MADLNYLDPKSPLQKIAEKLDGKPTTQVDPDSLMSRIATAVEDGAGGGGGGYSREIEEIVIFNGAAKFIPTVGEVDTLYQLYAPDSTEPDEYSEVLLDNFYDPSVFVAPNKLTITGVPEELFGTNTTTLAFDAQYIEGGTSYISYRAENTFLEIRSDSIEHASYLHFEKRINRSTEEYNVNLKVYGTSEAMEVTKDFTDAVEVVTGYSINKSDEILLNTTHVHLGKEVPEE